MAKIDERLATFDYDILWSNYSDTVCELVPLSQRETSIILSCLRVASWAARWFAGDDELRFLARWTDLEEALTYIERLERKLLMTGCLEGLIDVMGEIRDAIRAQASCCQAGSMGAGYSLIDGQLVYGTEVPLSPPVSFGGSGEFADEEEYLAHRCLAANNVVSGLVLSLNNWSVLSLVELTVGLVVVAFFVATPPVAVLIAFGVAAVGFQVFASISSYIDDHREDWVCALYAPDSYLSMLDAIDEQIQAILDALDIPYLEGTLTEVIHAMLATPIWNTLHSPFGLPPVDDPVDCSECPEYCEAIWGINTLICEPEVVSGQFCDNDPTTVNSCEGYYYDSTRAGHNTGALPEEDDERDVEFTSVSGGGSYYVTYRVGGSDTSVLKTQAELTGWSVANCQQLQVVRPDTSDTTPFTITYTVTLPA